MAEFRNIPGIMWAADILTGRRPLPDYKTNKEGKSPDFQQILEGELQKKATKDADKK